VNFFSSPAFLETIAESLYPGERSSIRPVEVDGRQFDALFINGRCKTELPFCDFLEERGERSSQAKRQPFLPTVCQRTIDVAAWPDAGRGYTPAPYTDFSRFESFEQFVRYATDKSSRAFEAQKRKRRKLEREVGPVRIVLRAERSETALVELCMTWKSAQYQRSNYVDVFASEKMRNLFLRLFEKGAITLSALYVGDRAAAIHMGPVSAERFYYWVPAYDTELQLYSPGVILMEELMRDCMSAGTREFDFLIGGEDYKFYYATHVRLIGPSGKPPLIERAWKRARPLLMEQVKKHQAAYDFAQRMKRKWRERSLG
jgi:CelD/BcsL family acetyltransferase involved in cellulose biosynthesis